MPDMIGFIKSRARIIYRFIRKIEKSLNLKIAVSIAERIEKSPNSVKAFCIFQKRKFIPENIIWEALSYLNDKRSPSYDTITKNKFNIRSEEIRFLVKIRESLSSPSPILLLELEEFIKYYRDKKKKLKNESEFRRLLIALITKKLTAKEAYDAFYKAELIDSITFQQVLRVLHKAAVEGEREVFDDLKKRYFQQITPAASVKLLYWEGRLKDESVVNFQTIVKQFCLLDKTLSREYKKYLLSLFEIIPEEKNMLDYQIKKNKLAKIKEQVEKAVLNGDRFSFVRLNDGEGYGFPNTLPCAFDMERQELHWWGEVLPPALRNKIQEDFRRSLFEHALVGIPSVFRFINELSINRDYSIFNNALLCRLFTICHGYLKAYDARAYITEGQINLYLFDREYIAKLARLAQRVIFISGAKREYLQPVFDDIPHATYIELPTHRLLKTEKFSYTEAMQPLPYVYENYLEQIRELAGPGVVFFISAGFIGKIFAAEVAKNGGVALDVGQTLINIVANHVDA
ncbi:hypothetical protein [Billgrantia ethanolica]|uniref:Uncharacterized protein n=1 Tax=Billgrantia ethanolica TaxID=2733486 RepID=A0ABS9A074_9GAMM|nr:hypothetical protein [Halomonas ethanolica]MCE8002216.1 hypothetical protein [Halomonas ethanolica]